MNHLFQNFSLLCKVMRYLVSDSGMSDLSNPNPNELVHIHGIYLPMLCSIRCVHDSLRSIEKEKNIKMVIYSYPKDFFYTNSLIGWYETIGGPTKYYSMIIAGGNLELIKLVKEEACKNDLVRVISSGYTDVLQHLYSANNSDATLTSCAARSGSIAMLQWLRSQSPPCPWDASACAGAAMIGNLEMLKWLRNQTPPCPWDSRVCSGFAKNGHLEMLQWARSQNPPCPWDHLTCGLAAANNHFETVKWCISQKDPSILGVSTGYYCAMFNRVDILKWLVSVDPNFTLSKHAILLAHSKGFDEVVALFTQDSSKKMKK